MGASSKTYWVNFQVGEPVSASTMVAVGGVVGEGQSSHYGGVVEGSDAFLVGSER